MTSVAVVDYLELDPGPRLVARECERCGARYFGRRNACASCFSGGPFRRVTVPEVGRLTSYSIVWFGAEGVTVPYVAAIVDCGGTLVRANLIGVAPDPQAVSLGMTVRLTTFSVGTDKAGNEAVAYAFEPIDATAEELTNATEAP